MERIASINKEKEIAAIIAANAIIIKAFETHDFKAASVYLTEDCDYITFNGDHLKGREAYIKTHDELMQSFFFKEAQLEGHVKEIRFLNDITAIVIATGAIRFRWQKTAPQSRQSINTNVWVKDEDGQWRLTAFHNCRIKEPGTLLKWLMKI